MNQKDRERLLRLSRVLVAVPFGHDNWKTSMPAACALNYQEDMRGIMPYYQKVVEGMIFQSIPNGDFEEGWDYLNPDELLDAIEEWVKMRKSQGWEDPGRNDFRYFFKQYLKEETNVEDL
jgi:hypothetical protein